MKCDLSTLGVFLKNSVSSQIPNKKSFREMNANKKYLSLNYIIYKKSFLMHGKQIAMPVRQRLIEKENS